jgi:hypothetical protein
MQANAEEPEVTPVVIGPPEVTDIVIDQFCGRSPSKRKK